MSGGMVPRMPPVAVRNAIRHALRDGRPRSSADLAAELGIPLERIGANLREMWRLREVSWVYDDGGSRLVARR